MRVTETFSTYKAYNGGNVIFGSNLRGNIIGKGQICDNKCRVTFSEHDSEITKDGDSLDDDSRYRCIDSLKDRTEAFESYSNTLVGKFQKPIRIVQNSVIRIGHGGREFDNETSPLVDDDLDEEEAIRETKKKNLENVVEDETLEIDEISILRILGTILRNVNRKS
ncbi:hypothetical protein Tco_0757452 [Tanacetum coccineum]